MDYTTLTLVKQEINIEETGDDDRLTQLITAASRAIDRHCTQAPAGQGDNYFELEDITNEVGYGQIDKNGAILCYPRKPYISSVASFEYRSYGAVSWSSLDTGSVITQVGRVLAFSELTTREELQTRISYTGGLSDAPSTLPADLIEAATVLTIRFYREAESGLIDAIGVPEIGQMVYTKAIPSRVKEMLKPYQRISPWA